MSLTSLLGSRFFSMFYLSNCLIIAGFVVLRIQPSSSATLAKSTILSLNRELQLYVAVIFMIMVKVFKSPTWDSGLGDLFLIGKVCILFVSYFIDVRFTVYFAVIMLFMLILFPQPRYEDPEWVVNLDRSAFKEEVLKSKKKIWVVQVHSVWNATCTQLSPLFGELSKKYGHDRLGFGKVDISQWPEIAQELKVDVSGLSGQLPTYISFVEGKETSRVPKVNADGGVSMSMRSVKKQDIIRLLDLDKLYDQAYEWEREMKNHPSKS